VGRAAPSHNVTTFDPRQFLPLPSRAPPPSTTHAMSASGSALAASLSDAELAIWDADFVNEECVWTFLTTKSKSKADERHPHADT
jgi:hypothetical protein